MELSDLRIFLAVARTHGITQAALELHTAQSSVSARIHALEKELGARRHARGVELTNAAGNRCRTPSASATIIRLAMTNNGPAGSS